MPSLNQRYAEGMKHQPFGFAFLHPVESVKLGPGSLGILLDNGEWTQLADLQDGTSMGRLGLDPPRTQPQRNSPEQITSWDPKVCSDVRQETPLTGAGPWYVRVLASQSDPPSNCFLTRAGTFQGPSCQAV